MRRWSMALVAGVAFLAHPTAAQDAASGTWSASGTLLESCTCAVPCTCNFGQGPSPHMYCYALFAYRLTKASWDGVDLSGLIVGGADGPKGSAGFIDARATPAQRPALEKIATAIFAEGGPANVSRSWTPVAIVHSVLGNDLKLAFGAEGGFRARMLLGRDNKTPIVVENNPVWPIARSMKAKSFTLTLHDEAAGAISGEGTNANCGDFSFSGKTAK